MRHINVNEILEAFSLALDIAENKTFGHAQRTAYIALQLARELGLAGAQLKDIYAAALLHDIGMVNALADVHADQSLAVKHCVAGKEIVKSLPLAPAVSEYIWWHHANWDGSGTFARAGQEIPLGAQIVYIADQLELKLRAQTNSHPERWIILDYVKSAAGTLFSPQLVEAFLKLQEREVFWMDYYHYNSAEVLARIEPPNETMLDIGGLENIAFTFAQIIDDKSPFTHNHSQGLTMLLSKLCAHYRFDSETTKKLEISGLLHDLGKLVVPNDILDKPGKLTPAEFQVIKGHPYYTKLILAKVNEFKDIKEWAANHHETLDGQGYPEGLKADQLSQQDKMIAICDIYEALTEERPYRQPLAQSKVYEIMGDLVKKRKICPEILADLKKILG